MGDNIVSASIQNHENASIQSCPRSKPLFRTYVVKLNQQNHFNQTKQTKT